jgi:uncharacterized protein (DUF1800 family)
VASTKLLGSFLTVLLLLSACGGTNDSEQQVDETGESSPTIQSGVLLDGVMQGIDYVASNEVKGVTDENGLFRYIDGEKVCFYLGKLPLGCAYPIDKPDEIKGLVADKLVTPLEMADAGDNLDDLRALNRVRLFLTLDKDQNANNGIQIDPRLAQSFQADSLLFDTSFNPQAILDEAAKLTGMDYHLVDRAQARTHLCQSLNKDNCDTGTDTNSAPLAIAQNISLPENTNKAITLTGEDAEGSTLSYDIVQNPAHGTLTGIAPNLSYLPTINYNGEDSFSFKVNDGELYSAPATINLSILSSDADITPPVITITGDNPVNVVQNTTYTDAGATASDNNDGDITASIQINNSVDTNSVGTYSVTYDVSDIAGNKATQVRRTVNVISQYPYLPETINDKTALNFLSMTTFGANQESIEVLKSKGIETWVNEQLAFTYESNNHFRRTIELSKKVFPSDSPASVSAYIADNDTVFNPEGSSKPTVYQMSAWFKTALFDENQLQHRVAYALSQIIVESLAEPIFTRRGEALATYFDILSKHALGNYRDLLIEISHSSSMGLYLTYHGSKKEEVVGSSTIYPDENYARELMQLFTIGLYELNLDGTVKTDASGNTIPTYTQTDVNELAKVFTGWDMKRNSRFGRVAKKDGDYSHPLEFTSEYHDYREKSVLGRTIQAGNDGSADMIAAVDILMAHPNVAPFISKQLIMRLVKSNPTPAYVARVAAVFNDNGQGVKGDLKAVVKAILLDAEVWEMTGVKKFKEPLLAYTEFLRAFHVQNLPTWKLSKKGEEIKNTVYFVDPTKHLGQGASRAYSVFNFYENGYIPNDATFKQTGLSAPELQIQTDSIFIGFSNNILDDLKNREKNYLLKKYGTLTDIDVLLTKSNLFYYSGSNKFLLDCKDEYAVMEEAIEGSSNGRFKSFNSIGRSDDTTADANGETDRDRALKALIVTLDNKLLAGTLGADKKDLLFESYKEAFYSNAIKNIEDPKSKIYEKIIMPIILAIATSENFMVQE